MSTPVYLNQCEGKRPLSKSRARLISRRLKQKTGGEKIIPYFCKCCGHYHVGHAVRDI